MDAPFTIDAHNWAWTAKPDRNLGYPAATQPPSWIPHPNLLLEVYPPAIAVASALPRAIPAYDLCAGSRFYDTALQSNLGFGGPETYGEKMVVFGHGGASSEYFPTTVGCPAYAPGVVATPDPHPFYESYPSGIGWVQTNGPSPLQRHLQLLDKLNFYHDVHQAIEEEIGLLKYDYLYDESTEIVRSHQEKLAVVESVIKQLQQLQQDPCDLTYLRIYAAAELRASTISDLYELRLQSTMRLLRVWKFEQKIQSMLLFRPIYAFLRLGQILRSFFKRRLVDIRRRFRTLVRTLFKQMDDQSGHDEFLALNQFLSARIYSSNTIFFQHEDVRNYRRA